MIREATVEDCDRIVELAAHFIEQTSYGQVLGPPKRDVLAFIVSKVIGDLGVILVAEVEGQVVGMLAIAALAHPFTGERYGDELCWWVEPPHRNGSAGHKLLCAGEKWAETKGLTCLKMVAPVGSSVGTYYERMGYAAVEMVYQKAISRPLSTGGDDATAKRCS